MKTTYRNGEIRETDEESRKIQFIISDATKDRHGTVLNMDGWDLEHFNRNGIVGYQHDVYGGGMCKGPDPDQVIGKGRAWLEEGQRANGEYGTLLMGEVEFEPEEINPLAEKIYRKVLNGTFRATSVGFSPVGGGRMVNDETGEEKKLDEPPMRVPEGHTFYYEGQELLEFSVVNIPSNPNALKRDLRNQTANALHFLKRELGQDITYGEIEQMRVLDVIKMLETGDKPQKNVGEVSVTIDGSKLKETVDKKFDELKKELHNEEESTSKEGAPLKTKHVKQKQKSYDCYRA